MKESGELPWFGVAGGEWLLTTGDLNRVVVRISEIVAVVGKGNAWEKNPGASIRLRSAQSIYVDQSADEVLRAIMTAGSSEEVWWNAAGEDKGGEA
jgi:hypothetical protein